MKLRNSETQKLRNSETQKLRNSETQKLRNSETQKQHKTLSTINHQSSTKNYYSHGKLLLTAEYLVLDGAKALAIPTQKGQGLTIEESDTNTILWKSLDENGICWFTTEFPIPTIQENQEQLEADKIRKTLRNILHTAQKLNADFLTTSQGYIVTTQLEFHQQWGLGSSSTLINNIAQWAQIDAFELLEQSFGGSGYDIACAQRDTPILYQRNSGVPNVQNIAFDPAFKDRLFFIYLNTKQDSKASIHHYRSLSSIDVTTAIHTINDITDTIVNCTTFTEFEHALNAHESQISKIIQTPTVKSRLFPDYSGSIKSLGGWGGDFVLVTGTPEDMDYFKAKGYTTIVPYTEMIFSHKKH